MRARATRRACPPEIDAAEACQNGSSFKRSSNISIQRVCSLSAASSLGMPNVTFSLTRRCGKRSGSCVRNPMGLLCNGREGGKSVRLPSRTYPLSGSSIPAMQESTVLFPAPETPNSPKESPFPSCRQTSTMSCRRPLMMCASSMAFTLSQNMRQPRKRQGNGKKNHEQWHHRRQTKALQIDPELNWHSGRIVCRHHNRTKLADGANPGDAQGDCQSKPGKRQCHSQ